MHLHMGTNMFNLAHACRSEFSLERSFHRLECPRCRAAANCNLWVPDTKSGVGCSTSNAGSRYCSAGSPVLLYAPEECTTFRVAVLATSKPMIRTHLNLTLHPSHIMKAYTPVWERESLSQSFRARHRLRLYEVKQYATSQNPKFMVLRRCSIGL